MSGESPLSPVRQRPKSLGQKKPIGSMCNQSSDSSPVFRRRPKNSGGAAAVGADSADVSSQPGDHSGDSGGAAAVVAESAESADVSSQPKPPKRSKRYRHLKNKFVAWQAKEDKGGISMSGSENSSDDDDKSDLSCVSQTGDHSNADRHVYLASLSSQGGFPTPMHKRRQKDSGMIPVAGMNFFHFEI
jgi:hypothetical protein